MSNFLTTEQAAELFGVSGRTVWHWVQEGRIKAQVFKGDGRSTIRIPRTEVERLLSNTPTNGGDAV